MALVEGQISHKGYEYSDEWLDAEGKNTVGRHSMGPRLAHAVAEVVVGNERKLAAGHGGHANDASHVRQMVGLIVSAIPIRGRSNLELFCGVPNPKISNRQAWAAMAPQKPDHSIKRSRAPEWMLWRSEWESYCQPPHAVWIISLVRFHIINGPPTAKLACP